MLKSWVVLEPSYAGWKLLFLSKFVKKIIPAHTFLWSGENERHLPKAWKENSGCRRREPEPGLNMRARKEGRQTPSWTKLSKSCRRWWDSNPNGPQVKSGINFELTVRRNEKPGILYHQKNSSSIPCPFDKHDKKTTTHYVCGLMAHKNEG